MLAEAFTGPKRRLPNQAELARPVEGLGAVSRAELAVDVARVALDGADGDEEVPSNLRVGLARGEEVQHLALAFAQGIFEPEGRPVAIYLLTRECGIAARQA